MSLNPLRSKRQSQYGWVVVAVSAIVNSLAWSVRSTFSAFYVALLGEFAWRRGEAALGYSLSWLLLLVFSPLAGWLYDRWGARLLVPAGGLLLGAALALTGRVTTLWQYYLAFGVLGGAGIACIQIPAAAIVSRWFVRSRGAAMGVISAGASASAIIFYPLNTYLIVVFGWRTALAIFGLLVAVVTIPLAAFLYRDPPENVEGQAGDCRSDADGRRRLDPRQGAPQRPVLGGVRDVGVRGDRLPDRDDPPGRARSRARLQRRHARVGVWTGWRVHGRGERDRRRPLGSLGQGVGLRARIGHRDRRHRLSRLARRPRRPPAPARLRGGRGRLRYAHFPAGGHPGRPLLGTASGGHSRGRPGGGGLGGFIGPFLGGWLFNVTGSYQIAFAVAALAIAASAVAAWVAAPRRARAPRRAPSRIGL